MIFGISRKDKNAGIRIRNTALIIDWLGEITSGDNRWWKIYYVKANYTHETRRTLYFKWFRIMLQTNITYEVKNE